MRTAKKQTAVNMRMSRPAAKGWRRSALERGIEDGDTESISYPRGGELSDGRGRSRRIRGLDDCRTMDGPDNAYTRARMIQFLEVTNYHGRIVTQFIFI